VQGASPPQAPFFFSLNVLIAAAVFACAALGAWWLWNGREPAFPWSSRKPGSAVAVFDFHNLSHRKGSDWIGPAFTEMLGTEMAQGGELHLLPGELVRSTQENTAPDAGGFSPASLARLKRQLAVDYVITGSYLASQEAAKAQIRLDMALQDARSGATVATFTRSGTPDQLPFLVSAASADLRKNLHIPALDQEQLRLAANARPPTPEVTRRIGAALDALHRYDPARARDELLQAVAAAPDYAPTYVWLAEAWSALGYKPKALAAAKQAAAHAAGLPDAMRLKIEAQSFEAQFRWPQAIAALQKLAALQHDDPETQLDLVNALLSAGKPGDAQNALDALRNRGEPIASDPRLELLAARIAAARDDQRRQRDYAARALQMAQARDIPGQQADAALVLGSALTNTDPKMAKAMLDTALAIYRRVGNPHGEIAARRNLGNLLSYSQPKQAIAEYRKSLALSQTIGDRNGEAAAYQNLATVLWDAGDRDSALTAVRDALQIRRETGDVAGQAWSLAALAIGESDRGPADDAIAGLEEAAALDLGIGAHSHRAFSLFSLSDLLRLRGDLAKAAEVCAQAQLEYRNVQSIASIVSADFECALIKLDRGDVKGAASELQRLRPLAQKSGDLITRGGADFVRGRILMGQRNWAAAAPLLADAATSFGKGELATGQANALGALAVSEAKLGKTRERDAAEKQARDLRARINAELEVFPADVSLAELRGLKGEIAPSLLQLEALAKTSVSRQCPGLALEAQLSELHVLQSANRTRQAQALRATILANAKKYGFDWVVQRAGR